MQTTMLLFGMGACAMQLWVRFLRRRDPGTFHPVVAGTWLTLWLCFFVSFAVWVVKR